MKPNTGALIDTLEATLNVDPERIYVNGLSNGGFMAFASSCRLSHRIAAVGTVAAAQALPWSWCSDERPVPVIAFHGTSDRLVPYEGRASWGSPRAFPSVTAWTQGWADRNRCRSEPIESKIAVDVTHIEYTGCAEGATVALYTVLGGGQTWPGGEPMPQWIVGATSNGIDATKEMWTFFRDHPLRR